MEIYEDFYIRGNRGDIDVINEVYLGDTYRIGQLNILPKILVDIGAHIGTFARLAWETWGDAVKIICIEPNPHSFQLLESNVAGHNVVLYQAAVRYDNHCVTLDDHNVEVTGGGFMISREQVPQIENSGYIVVNEHTTLVTIEQIIHECDITAIDLMKLDCEGSEQHIFEHLNPKVQIDTLVGEFHGQKEEFLKVVQRCFPTHKCTFYGGYNNIGVFHIKKQ